MPTYTATMTVLFQLPRTVIEVAVEYPEMDDANWIVREAADLFVAELEDLGAILASADLLDAADRIVVRNADGETVWQTPPARDARTVYYNGAVPVDEETLTEWGEGATVRIAFTVAVSDFTAGSGWNSQVADQVGVTLANPTYGFDVNEINDRDNSLGNVPVTHTVMWVEGTLPG